MKKSDLTNKNIYKNKIVGIFKKIYKELEIDDSIYDSLYNDINLKVTSDDNEYLLVLYAYKKNIENYIMNECMNNNLLYQLMMAEVEEKVVTRYLSLKKLNSEKKNISDISFSVMEKLIFDYDKDETLDHQYVKKLNQKFEGRQ